MIRLKKLETSYIFSDEKYYLNGLKDFESLVLLQNGVTEQLIKTWENIKYQQQNYYIKFLVFHVIVFMGITINIGILNVSVMINFS